ncbi:5'-3' exonuclease PLD3-like isoform X2 [Varanus komodoensis]|uniref:5'-3' exonuclease PLD3-like isoform X2 n=1 Tax=Varanus komodoensis TaxID=61221 RepID=UPI001CF76A3F|nr:5'-3' exonuclease PLD3-like isoform X2 [Varanus komodoensis]
MRKKEPKRPGSRETPLRRSSRLQQEKVGAQGMTSSEKPQGAGGSLSRDVLQPRESIRAYRNRVEAARDRSPSPPSPARGPLALSEPRPQTESGQPVLEQDTTLFPFVRLRRLAASQEDGPPPQQNRAKEKPNIDWEVVKDERARLQVLEARRLRGGKPVPPEDKPTPTLHGEMDSKGPRWQARPTMSAEFKRPAEKARPSAGQSTALPAENTKAWSRPLRSRSTLGSLLVLLILGLGCWLVWEHGSPSSLLGIMGYGQLTWSGFPKLWSRTEECSSQCSLVLVESIPDTLKYQSLKPHNPTTYQAWMDLLARANSSVEIAAFYFTLRDSDVHVQDPSSWQGKAIFESLRDLPSRGVMLNIAVNSPQMSENDTAELAQHGADVRHVDMRRLTGGIVHTKLWVVDQRHVYLGSANMDWRSLTQVKELGAVLYNCSCVARDLHRIFAIYRILGKEGAAIPAVWPVGLAAQSSVSHPLKLQLNGTSAELYLSSSPPALCSQGRTPDLSAILNTIDDAEDFVYIAVMDYEPQCSFCKPRRFWPVIDDALRTAACERRANVRLLVSCWQHSKPAMFVFLESLRVLSHEPLRCPIEVKLFVVPSEGEQPPIPYAHVNHNKYMVTDRVAYIGTSNWSEDYFVNTTGVGLVIKESEAAPGRSLRQQLEDVFLRDWTSPYAFPLSHHWECAKK